nr:MAG TPA: hypothetical protein [Bacteriophage sp.]
MATPRAAAKADRLTFALSSAYLIAMLACLLMFFTLQSCLLHYIAVAPKKQV